MIIVHEASCCGLKPTLDALVVVSLFGVVAF